jgi:hypothetical protein
MAALATVTDAEVVKASAKLVVNKSKGDALNRPVALLTTLALSSKGFYATLAKLTS